MSNPFVGEGFLGVRTESVVGVGRERVEGVGEHRIVMVYYRFPGTGERRCYLEVEERHCGGYVGRRLVPLSEAVHALLNLGVDEIFQVGNREVDWEGKRTEGTDG